MKKEKFTCSLGLKNPKGQGGTYQGRGIASVIRNIRLKFEQAGFIGRKSQGPHVFVDPSHSWIQAATEGNSIMISSMMESDKDFEKITCGGFGLNHHGHWTDHCKDCPYVVDGPGGPVIKMSLKQFFSQEELFHVDRVIYEIHNLQKKNAPTVEDFITLTEQEVSCFRTIGAITLGNYKKALSKHGLAFKKQ